jgi:hypothetical protein
MIYAEREIKYKDIRVVVEEVCENKEYTDEDYDKVAQRIMNAIDSKLDEEPEAL